MARAFRTTTARLWFAALYALAVIALGFGHRPPGPAAAHAAEAVAHVLVDGVAVSLCAGDHDPAPHQEDRRAGCDACRIAEAPGLAPAAVLTLPAPAGGRVLAAARAVSLVPAARPYRPVCRGPPAAAVAT